jgi:hypothetical protein
MAHALLSAQTHASRRPTGATAPHNEDSQPNEGINKRYIRNPPMIRSTAPVHRTYTRPGWPPNSRMSMHMPGSGSGRLGPGPHAGSSKNRWGRQSIPHHHAPRLPTNFHPYSQPQPAFRRGPMSMLHGDTHSHRNGTNAGPAGPPPLILPSHSVFESPHTTTGQAQGTASTNSPIAGSSSHPEVVSLPEPTPLTMSVASSSTTAAPPSHPIQVKQERSPSPNLAPRGIDSSGSTSVPHKVPDLTSIKRERSQSLPPPSSRRPVQSGCHRIFPVPPECQQDAQPNWRTLRTQWATKHGRTWKDNHSHLNIKQSWLRSDGLALDW